MATDAVVIGAGHNGLVAANLLAFARLFLASASAHPGGAGHPPPGLGRPPPGRILKEDDPRRLGATPAYAAFRPG